MRAASYRWSRPGQASEHLSYANVVATVALFIALGSGSYAAVTLERGSVKSRHIAKNAVTTGKVKDRSLLSQDFARGQLPRGERGEPGPPGAPGPAGPAGSQDTPEQVLGKLGGVDGSGSGLDADALDGLDSSDIGLGSPRGASRI
jgi:hypothetical protein